MRIYQASEMCRSPDAGPAELPPVSLIEDAENGDNQIVVQDGRDGYVYTFVDPASDLTQGSAPPTKMVVPIVGGAQGSRCAWNLRGKLADANIVFVGLGMNMSDPKAAYDAMLDQMYQQMSATMQQMGGKPIPASKQKALRDAVAECLPYEDLVNWSTDVYLKHFTRKEIDDLAAFYRTPTARRWRPRCPTCPARSAR